MTPSERARKLLEPWQGRCLHCGWTLDNPESVRGRGCTPGRCCYVGRDREQRVTVPPELLAALADEVERLRALLREAHESLMCGDAEEDGSFDSHRCGRCDNDVDRNRVVREKIDAALSTGAKT